MKFRKRPIVTSSRQATIAFHRSTRSAGHGQQSSRKKFKFGAHASSVRFAGILACAGNWFSAVPPDVRKGSAFPILGPFVFLGLRPDFTSPAPDAESDRHHSPEYHVRRDSKSRS